jgi:cyclopropane fatty-acyl-phospholipid synthase-like methyltransferase
VADIGSGTGYFAVRIARAVPRGRVYGADLEPDMVRFLNARAAREGLPNLASHVASADNPKLPAPVDLALVVDTYHHIANRSRYFERLRKSLKPGGRVAIVDFKLDSPVGPPRRHRIEPAQVKAEMERAGYRVAEQPAVLPYQYLLVFTPRS